MKKITVMLGAATMALTLAGFLGFRAANYEWAGTTGDNWEWAKTSANFEWAGGNADNWEWAAPDAGSTHLGDA
ncbi:hypothetical protein NMQ01_03860 [Janibacter sp. CX7]|uniref:hypothetical protein n=1 Tax=Janibacter sp. CX7 TaxID=2963431 RepID=UPI0020CFD3EE|nr:hypothetical protein [Janibacter sp. CX7]UTT66863.1 hypothetical protein NMQ01_03860 [Janibacter sp. CX7]